MSLNACVYSSNIQDARNESLNAYVTNCVASVHAVAQNVLDVFSSPIGQTPPPLYANQRPSPRMVAPRVLVSAKHSSPARPVHKSLPCFNLEHPCLLLPPHAYTHIAKIEHYYSTSGIERTDRYLPSQTNFRY